MMTRKAFVMAGAVAATVLLPLAVVRPVARAADAEAVPQARHKSGPAVRVVGRGLFAVEGVRIRAQAYVDDSLGHISEDTPYRSDFEILSVPPRTHSWGLTYTDYAGTTYPDLDHMGTVYDNVTKSNSSHIGSGKAYGVGVAKGDLRRGRVILHLHLHQYDTYDERVTFHDLHITRWDGSGFLTVTRPLTVTTPSGITVTLPVQNLHTFEDGGFLSISGASDVTTLCAVLTPGHLRCFLPGSPLYQRHHVPVRVTLETAPPISMNANSNDPSQPAMSISAPEDSTSTHLDSLTLIVHQRADLRNIPLALPVPVDRP